MSYLSRICTVLLLISGCTRPSIDTITLKPVIEAPEPPLVDMRSGNDSLYIGYQYISTRTVGTDITITCDGFTNIPFFLKQVRELGYCLSPTDSIVSVKNPQHIRVKAPFDENSYRFTATVSNLAANQRYFADSYFIMKDGRVYYGRSIKTGRWQFPSYGPKPPMNAITSFVISQPDKSTYKPLEVSNRASLPVNKEYSDKYLFTVKDKLYVLSRGGNLWQYNADQDEWVARQRLIITSGGGYFNGWPAVVFGTNGKGYVLYSDAFVPNPTYYWEYNPDTDQWVVLNVPDKLIVAPLKPAYQVGNRIVLRTTYQKQAVYFDTEQKRLQPLQLISLTNEPQSLISFVSGAATPFGYYTGRGQWENGKLYTTAYNESSDQFAPANVVSDVSTDTQPMVAFASGDDLLFGIGNTVKFLPDSRIHTSIRTKSDDLIRYSTTTKKLTARYDISTILKGYGIADSGNYQSFTVGGRPFVIDTKSNRMWELRF